MISALLKIFTSEESAFSLRTKQLIAAVVPSSLLHSAKKSYYTRLLKNHGTEFMEADARALPLIIKPGDFVIDIGAYVGFYTKPLSELVGDSGKVWAFEPAKQSYDILTHAVRRLGFKNVQAFNLAVSNSKRTVVMEVGRYKGGGESWYDSRIVGSEGMNPGRRQLKAETTTLDSLLPQMDRPVSFIKCDAEFHELECLRGSCEIIARWHPVWLIETLDNPYNKISEVNNVIEFMEKSGYAAFVFEHGKFSPRNVGIKSQNLFFFPQEHAYSN